MTAKQIPDSIIDGREMYDFTGSGLFEGAYSYETPSWQMANGIMCGLIKSGFSRQEAINWLHSKAYTHYLDLDIGTVIEKIGYEVGLAAGTARDTSERSSELSPLLQKRLDFFESDADDKYTPANPGYQHRNIAREELHNEDIEIFRRNKEMSQKKSALESTEMQTTINEMASAIKTYEVIWKKNSDVSKQ